MDKYLNEIRPKIEKLQKEGARTQDECMSLDVLLKILKSISSEETEYLGDPLLGRPYDLSFNKFLTTYKKWNLTGICFIRMNFFIFLN